MPRQMGGMVTQDRAERLAKALRDNLRRRKTQAREAAAPPPDTVTDGDGDADPRRSPD